MQTVMPLAIVAGAIGALTSTLVAQRARTLWLTSQLRSCRKP